MGLNHRQTSILQGLHIAAVSHQVKDSNPVNAPMSFAFSLTNCNRRTDFQTSMPSYSYGYPKLWHLVKVTPGYAPCIPLHKPHHSFLGHFHPSRDSYNCGIWSKSRFHTPRLCPFHCPSQPLTIHTHHAPIALMKSLPYKGFIIN